MICMTFIANDDFSTPLREWVQPAEPERVSSDPLRIEALQDA
jgi:hypothetical protein